MLTSAETDAEDVKRLGETEPLVAPGACARVQVTPTEPEVPVAQTVAGSAVRG